jgi:hypothetical protein
MGANITHFCKELRETSWKLLAILKMNLSAEKNHNRKPKMMLFFTIITVDTIFQLWQTCLYNLYCTSGKYFAWYLQQMCSLTRAQIFKLSKTPESVFVNVSGVQQSIPRNRFRQHMYYVARGGGGGVNKREG